MYHYISNLVFEVTRRCNMECAHCLRGPQEPINIKPAVYRSALQGIDQIGYLTFSGGEPSLNPKAIKEITDILLTTDRAPSGFYVATNGQIYSKVMVEALQRLYECSGDRDMCQLKVSNDIYHDRIREENWDRFNRLLFFEYEDLVDFDRHPRRLIMEGNAYDNGLGQPPQIKQNNFYVEVDEENIVVDSLVYINVFGDVIPDCDYSYENQKDHVLGNVLQEPLIDIIKRNSRKEY